MSQYSVSLSLQVQQALQSLKNLTGNFKKVDKEVAATTRELEKFEKELKDESATIKNTIGAQTQYINKLKGIQTGLDKSSAKFKAVSREITKFEGNLKGGTTAVQGLTGALAVLGAGAVLKGITGDVLQLGKEFSAAEGSVRTLTGAAGFDDVQASIQKVTQASGGLTDRIEATAASYQLLSAGVSGAEDIEKVLESSVALTTAGFTDQTTAVDALTTVINAYGLEADKAALLTDQLVQTQNDGKLTINEYGQSLGKVIPIAAQLNVSFAEVNAAVAGITLQGNKAEIATSGLNSALAKLSAPTKEGEGILAKYGITVNAASIKADGLVGTLEKLRKITSDQDRIELFGTEANKALGPLLNDFENFQRLVKNQTQATGVAKKAVDNLANGYATLSKKNENLRKDVGVAVFEQLKPAIGAVLVPINNLLAAFLQLPGPIKKVVIGLAVIVGVAVGIGLAAIAISTLNGAILAATGATSLWVAATTALAGAWAVITAPITLAVLAVAALIAGAVLLYNNFEPFKKLIDAIGNEFKYWGGEAINIIKAIGAFAGVMIDNYIKGWQEFFSVVGELWGRFTNFIGDGFESIKEKGSQTLDNIKNFFGNAKTVISNVWGALTGNVNKGTQSIGDTTNETTNGIQVAFGHAADWIGKKWTELLQFIGDTATKVLGGVSDWFKDVFNIDIMAGLNRAVEAAKKAYKGAGTPEGTTTGNGSGTTTNTPTGVTTPTGTDDGGGSKGGKSDAEKAAEKRQKEIEKSLENGDKLLRQTQREIALIQAATDHEKFKLQVKYDLEDSQRETNELINVGQKAALTELNLTKAKLVVQEKDKGLAEAKAKALSGVTGQLNDEITLLEAKLAGNEEEIKDLMAIKKLKQQIEDIPNSTDADKAAAVGLLQRKQALEATNKEQEKLKETTRQYAEAIVGPLAGAFREMATGAKSASEAFAAAFQTIADSFLDMAQKLITEWLVMQAIGLVTSLFGAGSNGATPLVDSLSGQGGSPFQPGGGMNFFGTQQPRMFANGGRPEPNKVSLIGEKGPELFVPDGPGTVLSNNQAFDAARDAMGGSGGGSSNAFNENADALAVSNSYTRERVMEKERSERSTSSGTMLIETQVINNVEYATIDQVDKAASASAKQARAQVFSDMRNKPSTRRQLGIR